MPDLQPPTSIKEFPLAFVKQSVALATSGFGIVVALAWNELVRDIIANYIEPYLGKSSGTVSKLIYALIMTFLAIVVTMQLTHLQMLMERVLPKKKEEKPPKKSASEALKKIKKITKKNTKK